MATPRPPDDAHREAVVAERAAREARLRQPMGWLTLVGLHWLEPGPQRFGGGADNDVTLRAAEGDLPDTAGTLEVASDAVRVHPAPGAPLTVDGMPVEDGLVLLDDEHESPTVLELASLRLVLIRRGGRSALRVRDIAASTLRSFAGLDYFPIDADFRVTARLVRHGGRGTVRIADILGNATDEETPGQIEFDLGGRRYRLTPLEIDDGRLWLLFRDATNGDGTYGGGRFLVTGPVQPDDTLEVDFNLAYNPPCVFSPYATCPMPPAENRMPVRVEAGERDWTA